MGAPLLFIAHGSPELALAEHHTWAQALQKFGAGLQARAILALSAHWETEDLRLTAAPAPGTLHDFQGFPEALSRLRYPAPGDPRLAARLAETLGQRGFPVRLDPSRPFDHGVWTVLRHLRPAADLPVLQLSLPRWEPARLLALGRALSDLPGEGLAFVASGGIVHNLGRLAWREPGDAPEPWAAEAEAWVRARLAEGNEAALLDHRRAWPASREAAPNSEHLDPLFPALGAAGGRPPRLLHEGFQWGSLSLTSFLWEEAPVTAPSSVS